MKITKDEAFILCLAIDDYKFKASEESLFDALTDLQERLFVASEDNRRRGRTSLNSGEDIRKRLVNTYHKKKEL